MIHNKMKWVGINVTVFFVDLANTTQDFISREQNSVNTISICYFRCEQPFVDKI